MTAILQPGDVIHLALPIGNTLYGKELTDQVVADQKFYRADYATRGVTVATFSHHSLLPAPVVVAIFRPAAGSGATS